MADQPSDNRLEVIQKAKEHLLKATNIEQSAEEMKVLDNFLFRCWQMRWLKRYEQSNVAKEKIIDAQRRAFTNNKVLFCTCDEVIQTYIENILNQPTEGLLYDLNRDRATVAKIFEEPMLMNEIATINVLSYLHKFYLETKKNNK